MGVLVGAKLVVWNDNLRTFTLLQTMEPVLLLGRDRFAGVDIRIRVKGGGHSSQVYAIRQAIAKALVAYTQKCKQ